MAAERPRSIAMARSAMPVTTETRNALSKSRAVMASWPLLFGLRDEIRDAIQFRLGQPGALAAKERRDGVLGGAVEERVDEMLEGGLAGGPPRHSRHVDVPEPFLGVAD